MFKAKLDMKSFRAVENSTEQLMLQIERRGMKDALLKAATPMVKKTKQLAPTRTGALRKSIGKKGSTNRAKQSAEVKIGPRKAFKFKNQKPSWYAHLVEFGHIAKTPGGKVAGFVPAKPFMRPAFEAEKAASQKKYAEELSAAIHRHYRRKFKR
jgi:HK97 gp10 family phage protein